METFLWIFLWVMLLPGALGLMAVLGKRALSRQLSEPAEKDEWAEYKRLATLVRERKAKEIAEWTSDFNELLQGLCKKHEYDGNAWAGWYKCIHCQYEEPWRYSGSCSCQTMYDRAITQAVGSYVLVRRSGNCAVHGRTSAREAAANLYRLQTEGGYQGLHRDHFYH